MSAPSTREIVSNLPIWRGPVAPEPISGGITNVNFKVEDAGESFVVRVGDDIPLHHVMRFNERAASQAAHRAGISPEVVHAEPGILVMRFIEGRTCTAEDIRDPARLAAIMPLLKRVHRELPRHLRGPMLAFWVFHVIRDYAHTLAEGGSRYVSRLPELLDKATELELGSRIWLIDWDYAGFNSPLFDLSNLASNNEFDQELESWMLRAYFGRTPEPRLMASYRAMKCASLLREAMWSMVSEIHSKLNFDYAAYTLDYMDRFARAQAAYDLAKVDG
jgi:thiamine kinase-like enzyme